jgi:hypothetical protein
MEPLVRNGVWYWHSFLEQIFIWYSFENNNYLRSTVHTITFIKFVCMRRIHVHNLSVSFCDIELSPVAKVANYGLSCDVFLWLPSVNAVIYSKEFLRWSLTLWNTYLILRAYMYVVISRSHRVFSASEWHLLSDLHMSKSLPTPLFRVTRATYLTSEMSCFLNAIP